MSELTSSGIFNPYYPLPLATLQVINDTVLNATALLDSEMASPQRAEWSRSPHGASAYLRVGDPSLRNPPVPPMPLPLSRACAPLPVYDLTSEDEPCHQPSGPPATMPTPSAAARVLNQPMHLYNPPLPYQYGSAPHHYHTAPGYRPHPHPSASPHGPAIIHHSNAPAIIFNPNGPIAMHQHSQARPCFTATTITTTTTYLSRDPFVLESVFQPFRPRDVPMQPSSGAVSDEVHGRGRPRPNFWPWPQVALEPATAVQPEQQIHAAAMEPVDMGSEGPGQIVDTIPVSSLDADCHRVLSLVKGESKCGPYLVRCPRA